MKFYIDVPSGFNVQDKGLDFYISNVEGRITVSRNGTNFKTLDEYLNDYDKRQQPTTTDTKKLSISGYDVVSRIISFPEQKIKQKSYYIYVNGAVFIISTQSESLYSDLDQIAQSFRYSP